MGKVKPSYIKKKAMEIYLNNPDKYTTNFDYNRIELNDRYEFGSKRIRNKIAGYIITIIKTKDNNYEKIKIKKKEELRSHNRRRKKRK